MTGCVFSCARQKTSPLICPSGVTRQKTFEAALAVLGGMHFSIDKADPNTGFIRTHPLPGAQFFEVWRSDNVTIRDQVQANLHSLHREVWITVAPRGRDMAVDCQVRVQRMNVPSQEVSSSATAFRTLSESTVDVQSLRLSTEQKKAMEWVEQSPDTALAGRILSRIEARLKQNTGKGKNS